MPRRDVPCAGCGKLLQGGRGSLPAGHRRCRECRGRGPDSKDRFEQRRCELPACGVVYLPTHARQRFCSQPCARKSLTHIMPRPCEVCGTEFKPGDRKRDGGYVQRTCGRICGVELRHREGTDNRKRWPTCKIYVRECGWCGILFVGRNARTRGCSPDHRSRLNWASDSRRVHQAERHCQCGQQIPLQRQACDDCVRESARQVRRRRKARQRGAKTTERYKFSDIAARDRYHCGICHKRVAMTKTVPHPKAPTIDHVVPLA